jgi:hypothetical protein
VILFCWVFAIAFGLLLLVEHHDSRRALLWSAMWGVAGGTWLLAPRLVTVHHIIAVDLRSWLILDSFIVLTFGAIGGVLGIAVSGLLTSWRLALRREPHNRVWSNALWPALWLPVAYLAASASIEFRNFSRLDVPVYVVPFVLFFVFHMLGIAVLAVLFRSRALGTSRDGRMLFRGLAAAAIVGFAVLPFRSPALFYVPDRAAPLSGSSGSAPLLVVGLDGGNWRTLRPLIDAGKLPTLASLVAKGATGDMEAAWPPFWSAPAWAAILTGYGPAETGVHEDLAARVRGLPDFELPLSVDPLLNPVYVFEYVMLRTGIMEAMPTPRSMLKRAPIWERLSQAGIPTAVVRFPFTYPAPGQADYVISNRVVNDLWDAMGVRTGDRTLLAFPEDQSQRWLAHFDDSEAVDEPLVRAIIKQPDWPKPADSFLNPIDVIRRVVHVQRQMHDATLDVIRHNPRTPVVMLYVAGLDNLSHALWQYRFPEDYPDDPPSLADVRQFGPAFDGYLQLFDRQLAELIRAFPTRPDVLIVSDHGEGPSTLSTLWRGWHSSKGIFIAAGPGVPRSLSGLVVHYADVVPTMLDLLNVPVPIEFTGRSVLSSTETDRTQPVPRWLQRASTSRPTRRLE